MNRTGLFITLSLALVNRVIFGVYPDIDLSSPRCSTIRRRGRFRSSFN